jgi:hypothetical protein
MSHNAMNAFVVAAAALSATACTQAPANSVARGRVPPAAVAAGAPVSCIQTSFIDNTRVYGDNVIDFHMRGGQVYRNTLPNRCPTLGFEQRFGYKTTVGQLCSLDTITVLQNSAVPGPTCGLGKFQPVRITPRR